MDVPSILYTIAGDFSTTGMDLGSLGEDLRGLLAMLEEGDYPGSQTLTRDLIGRIETRRDALFDAAGRARRLAEALPRKDLHDPR